MKCLPYYRHLSGRMKFFLAIAGMVFGTALFSIAGASWYYTHVIDSINTARLREVSKLSDDLRDERTINRDALASVAARVDKVSVDLASVAERIDTLSTKLSGASKTAANAARTASSAAKNAANAAAQVNIRAAEPEPSATAPATDFPKVVEP